MKMDSKNGFNQAIDVDTAVQSPPNCPFIILGYIGPSQLQEFKQ